MTQSIERRETSEPAEVYDLEPVPPVIHDAAEFEPEHFVDS